MSREAHAHPRPIAERELLESVCHDLKVPLASLTMGVAFLRRTLPRNDEPTSKVIDALCRTSERMSRTIMGFADLAKLQMGELELELRWAVVGDVTQTAFNALMTDTRADPVERTLDVDAATAAVRVWCDPARVVQILGQLAVCAGHVLPAAEKIALRARSDGPAEVVVFEVEGTRAQGATAPPECGALPKPELTIAEGLVALHGGRLDVALDSRALTLSFAVPTA